VDDVLLDLETRIIMSGGKVHAGPLPVIHADYLQMRQLFQNLIANALKFHRENIPPVVGITSAPAAQGFWTITVEDNGIGFDPKYLDRIFKPFERLHGRGEYEGSGMGLAICKKIVTRHGGSISAASEPQKGARFIVSLPGKHVMAK
jgi:signal transduction histidine kinase